MTARLPLCLAAASCLVLSGCATVMGDVRPFDRVAPSPYDAHPAMAAQAHPHAVAPAAQPAPPAYAAPATGGGSIYASAAGTGNRGLRLYQDNKAREVGDLLTIVLVERTASRSVAQTSVTKDAGIGMSAPTIAGMPVTYKGKSILEAEVEGSRDFAGVGNSTQANQLDGDITVSVVRNLGNGNLLVSGEKRMRLNQGDELVQVQGIVRTADIGPDNRIPSDRVGEARIVYGGRGTLARSNAMGWLGRFFNSAAFPY
ncbi:flagellar basal body L-ring protein FlgH [Lysobacter sp. A3-1-A15]|uniref:flagellar basal body L-ring protein FlgH n=3 Tax=Novilysobacter viscosus TaxID=3098602 RepID=UPI0039836237